ncbi:hypothetical protein DPMN_057863 [Dreissena polymorpha]|uniref:Uncharacterized protein n=1 Tax=Dreissena polymorpha TaxID=45954 RepID=A0A9D4HCR0_DREPO|nr:hypothetical protein DPMN_057863 [Dreissena polymorpha]
MSMGLTYWLPPALLAHVDDGGVFDKLETPGQNVNGRGIRLSVQTMVLVALERKSSLALHGVEARAYGCLTEAASRPINVQTKTTLCGGSLGSCDDEQRSQLRELIPGCLPGPRLSDGRLNILQSYQCPSSTAAGDSGTTKLDSDASHWPTSGWSGRLETTCVAVSAQAYTREGQDGRAQ